VSDARSDEADRIFEEAFDLPPEERVRLLESACGDDAALRAEVEELLAAHDIAGGILDVDPSSHDEPGDAPLEVRRIGPYRVLRELGRGGMGVVYLAERDDGQFRRSVAIKLLKDGPNADELRARFTAERHILASLDHPHIAQLLDAGVTDSQGPHLVMEYVDGLPITTYCDRHRLDVRARLRLFEDVCAAVHHAHRNLVIHRDLKPSNILVTGEGVVKLLDFGIAKLQAVETSTGPFPVTRTRVRVMTPEYASPEQARGAPLSTASDVYSLGVVLYEILTGRRPVDLSAIPPGWFAEVIGGREPTRPSTAVVERPEGGASGEKPLYDPDGVAEMRGTTPDRLRRALRVDLDAIVMMALRKEPAHRYGSANLLAEDIRRYLEGLPVLAHRGSRRYHLGKFVRRHRAAAAIVVLAAASVLSGAGVALWQASVARSARDRAETARDETARALTQSQAVTAFLVGLFEESDPQESPVDDVTARDLLRRGIGRIEGLSDQPLVQARVLEAVGRVYRSLGQLDEARTLLERALANRRAALGHEDPDVARTLTLLADVTRRQGHYAEADARAREALGIQERSLGPGALEVAETMAQLSGIAIYRGDHATAESLARRALAIHESSPEAGDSLMAESLVHLANTIRRLGKNDEAEAHLRRAVAIARRSYGTEHAASVFPLRSLAYLLGDLGRLDDAEPLLREALEVQLGKTGTGNPGYAYVLGDLADVQCRRGEHAAAVDLFEQELGILRRVFGPDYQGVASLLGRQAIELVHLDDLDRAEATVRDALDLTSRNLGEEHQSYADLLSDLADVLRRRRLYPDAERDLRRAIAIRSRVNGPATRNVGVMRASLGRLLLELHRFPESEVELTAALAIFERSRLPEEDENFQNALRSLDALYTAWGRPAEAARYRARVPAG